MLALPAGQAGSFVWETLHRLLDRLGRADAIDWSWDSIDSASCPWKWRRGERAEPDRSWQGRHKGYVLISAANVHDSLLFEARSGRQSYMPTKGTTSIDAEGRDGAGTSFRASRAAASRAAMSFLSFYLTESRSL